MMSRSKLCMQLQLRDKNRSPIRVSSIEIVNECSFCQIYIKGKCQTVTQMQHWLQQNKLMVLSWYSHGSFLLRLEFCWHVMVVSYVLVIKANYSGQLSGFKCIELFLYWLLLQHWLVLYSFWLTTIITQYRTTEIKIF